MVVVVFVVVRDRGGFSISRVEFEVEVGGVEGFVGKGVGEKGTNFFGVWEEKADRCHGWGRTEVQQAGEARRRQGKASAKQGTGTGTDRQEAKAKVRVAYFLGDAAIGVRRGARGGGN